MNQEVKRFEEKKCKTWNCQDTGGQISIERELQELRSTLYNPVRGEQIDWSSKYSILSESSPDMLILPALQNNDVPVINTKFGKYPKGSVISYHQPLESNCIINLYDGISFPEVPVRNVTENQYLLYYQNPRLLILKD